MKNYLQSFFIRVIFHQRLTFFEIYGIIIKSKTEDKERRMDNYSTYILVSHHENATLSVQRVSAEGARLCDAFLYHGNFTYLPLPGNSGVAIAAMHGKSSPAMTEWIIRTLAGDIGALVLNEEGEPAFLDSDDNDISFLESIPAPEEEAGPIRLQFTIHSPNRIRMRRVLDVIGEFGYEINEEADGIAVALSASIYMDLFFSDGDREISAEVDISFGGARLYLDALQLVMKVSQALDAKISATPDSRITYASDRDFEKLRRTFYAPLKQQLSFAVMDDRDGVQAFFGWGTDNIEPLDIPGTIVSPFGRMNIERLKNEIRLYGFSYVADHYMLACNTPTRDTDFYVRDGLIRTWNQWLGRSFSDYIGVEQFELEMILRPFETALELRKGAPFPVDIYKKLCQCVKKTPLDTSACTPYLMHYEPSYRLDEVFYGFGHYLRRFRLPGSYPSLELSHGFDGVFIDDFGDNNRFSLEFAIKYFDEEAPQTENFGYNYAEGEIDTFDIGGTSYGRFCAGGFVDGRWRAEAEITIRDERYHFALSASDADSVDMLRDALFACRSIEEWYDDYSGDEFDPHAPGGTFCLNGDLIDPAMNNPFPDERYEHILFPQEDHPPFIDLVLDAYTPFQPIFLRDTADILSVSKIGGNPFLPDGVTPPAVVTNAETVTENIAGKPMQFIAQINCAEVHVPHFPKTGMISIWALFENDIPDEYVSGTQNRFRVLYFPTLPASNDASPAQDSENARMQAMLFGETVEFGESENGQDRVSPFPMPGSRVGGTPRMFPTIGVGRYDMTLLRLDDFGSGERPFGIKNGFALELLISRKALEKQDFSDVMLIFKKW